MHQSNANKSSDWRAGFLFLGNQLTLDLLNTRPALTGKPQDLLSDFPALLKWFHAAGLLSRPEITRLQERWDGSTRAEATLGTIRRLREILRREVLRWESEGKILLAVVRQLNLLMARHPVRSKLTERKGRLAMNKWFDARQPEDLLAPLAQSAAELFTKANRTRVRKCAHCVGHFLDTSKKGTRRWCSMKMCGNRFKVAAYVARQRRHSNS